jgi:hypothetical protein
LRGGEWTRGPSFWTTPGFCRELMHVFHVERAEEGEAKQQEDEAIELVRIPVTDLGDRLGEIEDAKTLAGTAALPPPSPCLSGTRRRGTPNPPPTADPNQKRVTRLCQLRAERRTPQVRFRAA